MSLKARVGSEGRQDPAQAFSSRKAPLGPEVAWKRPKCVPLCLYEASLAFPLPTHSSGPRRTRSGPPGYLSLTGMPRPVPSSLQGQ